MDTESNHSHESTNIPPNLPAIIVDNLKSLTRKRAYIRRSLTLAEQNDDNPLRLADEIIKIESLVKSYNDFEESVFDPEFENVFPTLKTEYDRLYKLKELLPSPTNIQTGQSAINAQNNTNVQVKLPTINLPNFSGNFKEWYPFMDSFNALVGSNESLNDLQKLQYLKATVTGDAAAVISTLQTTEVNYLVAIDLLKQTFENKRIIHQSHMDELFTPPKIAKEDAASYRKLLNSVVQNMRALYAMKRPVEYWDDVFVQLIRTQFSPSTRLEWENSIAKNHIPTFAEIQSFVIRKCQALEVVNENDKRVVTSTVRKTVSVNMLKCNFCKNPHTVTNCRTLLDLDVAKRIDLVSERNLCKNCLRSDHKTGDCTSGACKRCNKRHHTLLHLNRPPSAQPSVLSVNLPERESKILLYTCVVKVKDNQGRTHDARILLDSASEINVITQNLVNKLKLPKLLSDIAITGMGNKASNSSHYVWADLIANNEKYIHAKCHVMNTITGMTPSRRVALKLNLPKNVSLADPNFNKPGPVDILLGGEYFSRVLYPEKIAFDLITLQNTMFGWVVGGPVDETNPHARICNHVTFTQLNSQIQKFWEIENVDENLSGTADDKFVDTFFANTTTRDESGNFIVRLPWKTNPDMLGSTYNLAVKRLCSVEKRLNKDIELREQYTNFMHEYEKLGHMHRITLPSPQLERGYYLPHHGVLRKSSSTTKLRVVFDASAKSTNGMSLNDALLTGPNLQGDLLSIIIRFRTHQYVITADIKMMYRQIQSHDDDNKYQRILWRTSPMAPIEIYELKTVTYGTSCAPYLAIKTLKTLAEDAPCHIKTVILNDFYMDDLLTGAATISDLQGIRDSTNAQLKKAGFELRKWAANDSRLLNGLKDVSSNDHKFIFADDSIKTLGVSWNPRLDNFEFTIPDKTLPEEITKRNILSTIAQFFDPLGIIGPVIILAKILMQKLWQQNLSWDDSVPANLRDQWLKLVAELKHVNKIIIPRKVIHSVFSQIELHAYGDASISAYGAAVYLRSKHPDGFSDTTLVCAKSRVAPLKALTLPRLELCAAVLTAQLANKVQKSIPYRVTSINYYTDSTIVLAWINSPSTAFKQFVSHRIGEIHTLTESRQWRHVSSDNNPADVISRGAYPLDLVDNHLWFHGPSIPQQDVKPPLPNHDKVSSEFRVMLVNARQQTDALFFKFTERISNYSRLLRVVAWIVRFTENCRGPKQLEELFPIEIERAERVLLRAIQYEVFHTEIDALSIKSPVDSKSRLLALHPFLDENGLLRVGGRLRHSQLKFDAKFPVLLPPRTHVTSLIIRQCHEVALHSGVQGTIAQLRTRFWLIAGKTNVRREIRKCIKCFRAKPTPGAPVMGDLPVYRTEQLRAFSNTGVDYAGPFSLKESKRKTAKSVKVYLALFVCMSTKAVHLEVVSDLTTDAFLGALRRFISRRGYPTDLYSDNGTNFIGADREIKRYLNMISKDKKLAQELSAKRISWHFIPPNAPHFGGLWEAAVKKTKHHLRRVASNANLTWEELHTLFGQIEAILNSRPLVPLTNDPSDLSYLTPGHFLIGTTLTALPEPDLREIKIPRLSRWQHIQYLQQHFWTRWSKEYLQELQVRHRWRQSTGTAIQMGQLVLIKEDNMPPNQWKTGRIIEVHPGADGVVRAATVRTVQGTLKRPSTKLCPFPENDQNASDEQTRSEV